MLRLAGAPSCLMFCRTRRQGPMLTFMLCSQRLCASGNLPGSSCTAKRRLTLGSEQGVLKIGPSSFGSALMLGIRTSRVRWRCPGNVLSRDRHSWACHWCKSLRKVLWGIGHLRYEGRLYWPDSCTPPEAKHTQSLAEIPCRKSTSPCLLLCDQACDART